MSQSWGLISFRLRGVVRCKSPLVRATARNIGSFFLNPVKLLAIILFLIIVIIIMVSVARY